MPKPKMSEICTAEKILKSLFPSYITGQMLSIVSELTSFYMMGIFVT